MENSAIVGTTKDTQAPNAVNTVTWSMAHLRLPTLGQLLETSFKERRHLLYPWFREQESCMVYAATGVGKSLFALSVGIAVAGGGEFLGWKVDKRPSGEGWKVLYVDGEMHIADIQERARTLINAIPGIDRGQTLENLSFLARQYQGPKIKFPVITDENGMKFYRDQISGGKYDLIILDNFSTLGEVEDENAAASFNSIQDFLLSLKASSVATLLVHHAGKSGGTFRGSSKLATTFETIIELEKMEHEEAEHGEAKFRVRWDKVRSGGPNRKVREVAAKLITKSGTDKDPVQAWEYEAERLALFDEMRDRLERGEFQNQAEMGRYYRVVKSTVRNRLDHGILMGFWTDRLVELWFAEGKRLRRLGKTQAPLAVEMKWQDDIGETEEEPVVSEF